ncbi:helix-turn-helix domain-containing protein [Leisingera sp. ANG59]|uniref:helix-turn-helix domain-containing protein n=1 Tax=Leisingera sp. ANG59 TaxID=2675221 RepID=UPI001571FD6C|nr:helix-turn-helix domain-containing protein [Leisingera sp. ANG59]NSY41489.1 helix-turn-helix domain-containing protein [Leisingera sp. ANG59]
MAHIELDLRGRRATENTLNAKTPVSQIATALGRHRSTVYREIKRNFFSDPCPQKCEGHYDVAAQLMTADRQSNDL